MLLWVFPPDSMSGEVVAQTLILGNFTEGAKAAGESQHCSQATESCTHSTLLC